MRANRREAAARYAYSLWTAGQPEKLSESARTLLTTPANSLFFSAASIREIVIKLGLGRADFKFDPYRLRKMLVVHGYTELPVTAEHALKIDSLPPLHKDPFDRLLLAQARSEGMLFLTGDASVSNIKNRYWPYNRGTAPYFRNGRGIIGELSPYYYYKIIDKMTL